MKPYLLFFAAVYSIALVLLITVLIFGLKLGGITLLPALIAAAFISAGHFVKKEQRLPSSEEKIQLVWGSSAVAIIIGSFFVFFLVLMNPNAEEILKAADKAGLALAAVIMMCLIAIHGAVFHVAYWNFFVKNIAFGCLIGFGFFFLSACSNDKAMSNTTKENTATATKTVVVKSEFNFEDLEKTEYIAETHNSRIGRYIDCTAGVTIYTHGTSISVITNAQISQKLIEEKCK